MTNYSRSVLKSNGLRHSKNLPVKFSFSPKTIPADIAKKLPPQCCSKPLFIAFFNSSHKRPTFAFTGESGYSTRPCSKDRTQGLTRRNRGHFGRGWYHYPRIVLCGSETLRGRVSERQTLPLLRLDPVCSRRTQRAFGTAMRSCASLSRGVAAPLGCVIFFTSVEIAASTPCAQGFLYMRKKGGITTLGVLCVLLKRRTAACQND